MSQLPIMPMIVDAMLGDTLHLSAAEFGAYNLLIFATWRNNAVPFPDSDIILARICRMTNAEWKRSRPALVQFFDIRDGFWRQNNLEKQWKLATERASRARENGHRGGRPRRSESEPENNPAGSDWDAKERTRNGSNHNHNHPVEPKGSSGQEDTDCFAKAVDSWNSLARETGLSKVGKLTDMRRRSLKARLSECDGLSGWSDALAKIRTNSFLLGDNDRGWKADFDFLLQSKSFTKLMEGGYDRKPIASRPIAIGESRLERDLRSIGAGLPDCSRPMESFSDLAAGDFIEHAPRGH